MAEESSARSFLFAAGLALTLTALNWSVNELFSKHSIEQDRFDSIQEREVAPRLQRLKTIAEFDGRLIKVYEGISKRSRLDIAAQDRISVAEKDTSPTRRLAAVRRTLDSLIRLAGNAAHRAAMDSVEFSALRGTGSSPSDEQFLLAGERFMHAEIATDRIESRHWSVGRDSNRFLNDSAMIEAADAYEVAQHGFEAAWQARQAMDKRTEAELTAALDREKEAASDLAWRGRWAAVLWSLSTGVLYFMLVRILRAAAPKKAPSGEPEAKVSP